MKKESKLEIYDLLTDLSSNKKQSFVLATTNLIETVRLSDKIILMSKKPGKIIKEIKINKDDKPELNNHKSEIFTTIKSEIETSFQAVESFTMINYSV
jgi:ABC-type nitrate/sulfonate/bicarbonate transport system ATPase subunit